MTQNLDNSEKKTSTRTTSRKKTATPAKSFLTASGGVVELRCSEEFVAAIDDAVDKLYTEYNGYEIAEAIARRRKRLEALGLDPTTGKAPPTELST